MPPRSLLRAFIALWLVSAGVLLIGSVLTIRAAVTPARGVNPHLVVLGGVEALAAVLFVIPRTFRVGAIGLLVTIGLALVTHTLLGQFRGDLILYATVVAFVLVHGPLTPIQWRAARSRPAA